MMNLKQIFVGFANIFKSKEKIKANNNSHYNKNHYEQNDRKIDYSNNIITDTLDKEEINFEKLKKISEHTAIYNENEINGMNVNKELTQSIITNTLLEKTKEKENIRSITIHELQEEINTIWDVLKIKENTQAEHIIKATPADKWVTMDEIRNSIKMQFNIEYANEKSLYPYLKTLVDINLIKMNNIGKKRTWKKNIIVIEVRKKGL